MTNSSSRPLEIKHEQIDPAILEAVRKIDEIARKHKTSYFLAGASAREIMLRHVFGRPPGRRTLDVDLGIAVRDWGHFTLLKGALIEEAGFQPHARMVQRLTYPSKPSVIVDLIPFGGVEGADRTIAWLWRSSTVVPMRCLRKKQAHLLKKHVRILARSPCNEHEIGTVLARFRPKIMVSGWNEVWKYFRINSADHVGA